MCSQIAYVVKLSTNLHREFPVTERSVDQRRVQLVAEATLAYGWLPSTS